MSTQAPRGWIFTLGLAALAVLGALAARAATLQASESDVSAQVDSCVRWGQLECCIKDD